MTTLTATARETIKHWYPGNDDRIHVTIAAYIRQHSDDGKWHGDRCGCPDDRCIGYHHDEHEDCGCLPAMLDQWVLEQRAQLEGTPIWEAYTAATQAEDPESIAAATPAAGEWVKTFHGSPDANNGWGSVVSFSLDTEVRGRRGISIRNRFNDLDWLVWEAPSGGALLADPPTGP